MPVIIGRLPGFSARGLFNLFATARGIQLSGCRAINREDGRVELFPPRPRPPRSLIVRDSLRISARNTITPGGVAAFYNPLSSSTRLFVTSRIFYATIINRCVEKDD